MAQSARELHGLAATDKRRRRMKMKWIGQVLALSAFAAFTAVCSRDELEDETEDVVEAQQEAARVAEENPNDTAAIREAGEEVQDEQVEAAREMRKELKEQGLDSSALTTRE
jgi:hypothetical protein